MTANNGHFLLEFRNILEIACRHKGFITRFDCVCWGLWFRYPNAPRVVKWRARKYRRCLWMDAA